MGIITIFRLTVSTDTENTLDKIEFNVNEETNIENAMITQIEYNPTEGVGNNQGAEQELGDQQALGIIEDVIKISGFITQRDGTNHDGGNAFLILFNTWESEAKSNQVWQLGRFGFKDEDDQTEDVIPIRTGENHVALLWERIRWVTDMAGNRKMFELYLRVNRGDGT